MFLRSDRGAETAIMADIHYNLGVSEKSEAGEFPEDGGEWPLREFYLYGTSTANVRIESWWGQLRRGQTGVWIVWKPSLKNVRG
jgi:hypothetical protein